MTWLAIDTATDRASVALGGPGGTMAQETIIGARRHAAGLLLAVEACLERAGMTYGHIEGIALADGPGSFTGLRVGAAVAKALIRADRIPFWVAPSLQVVAAGAAVEQGATVVAVANALRGELFAAAYRFWVGRVQTVLIPTVVTPSGLLQRLTGPFVVAGPAAPVLGGEPSWPDAVRLLELVGAAGGARLVAAPDRWEPEYGRPAEAQAKWEREHGQLLAHPASRAG
ncbi:MAG TPA: tRNA (adenosine(37)-N6)-threonylcarbamoyltransferase complex dimerization subunit type 1 TsaB [Gemmatimonadales bacterium]|nr:tRNA (adenosine(37)-N6)-threonylcarbamoyltransferase complex dimerization subunit type 1 TsaB [Gemmatimonadales bacterium]